MPAPRASSADDDRSNTVTSQPASRSTSAAVSPPREPPTTATAGMSLTPTASLAAARSGPAEGRDRVDLQLEQHPTLVERWVAQRVLVAAGVLLEDLVQLRGDPRALHRVVLGDLPDDGRLDAEPVIGVGRVHQAEGGLRVLAQPVDLLPVRGQVEQHRVALVVEPDRGQVGPAGVADDRD